jgi:hypothetical protein
VTCIGGWSQNLDVPWRRDAVVEVDEVVLVVVAAFLSIHLMVSEMAFWACPWSATRRRSNRFGLAKPAAAGVVQVVVVALAVPAIVVCELDPLLVRAGRSS